jgi:hypothetical protein
MSNLGMKDLPMGIKARIEPDLAWPALDKPGLPCARMPLRPIWQGGIGARSIDNRNQ